MAESRCRLFLGVAAFAFLLAAAGCGENRLAGEYFAEVQLAAGAAESGERGYSLDEMREKLRAAPQSLKLDAGGGYAWNTGSGFNEGRWRVEDGALVMRDEVANGVPIQASLRRDRKWRLGPGGEIINDVTFRPYNLEIVFRRR